MRIETRFRLMKGAVGLPVALWVLAVAARYITSEQTADDLRGALGTALCGLILGAFSFVQVEMVERVYRLKRENEALRAASESGQGTAKRPQSE